MIPELQAADIAIRFGPYLPQEESQLLATEEVFPVCSPEYARLNGLGSELRASDLSHITLLHQDIHEPRWLDWLGWCDQVGIELRRGKIIFPTITMRCCCTRRWRIKGYRWAGRYWWRSI